jgi:hypothetical protein
MCEEPEAVETRTGKVRCAQTCTDGSGKRWRRYVSDKECAARFSTNPEVVEFSGVQVRRMPLVPVEQFERMPLVPLRELIPFRRVRRRRGE